MPELPEVETIARQLNKALSGQTIRKVDVRREKSFPHFAKATRGKAGIVGRKVAGVKRRAKMVIVELSGEVSLLIHLKMTGQLVYQENDPPSPRRSGASEGEAGQLVYQVKSKSERVKGTSKFDEHTSDFKVGGRIVGGHPTADWVRELPSGHTRVTFELSKGTLFFNDSRVFGWIKAFTNSTLKSQMEKLPFDVVDKGFTLTYLGDTFAKTRRAVKLTITDQAKMGGVGNIYANDALWEARIDPRRGANTLRDVEVERLYRGIRKVIKAGIKYGGATASDDKFVHTTGLGGKYQEHFLVYDRAGEHCKRRGRVPDGTRRGCSGKIRRITLGGRGTFYCPECQR